MRKTISLPDDLARDLEEAARSENKSVSAVVQEALRLARQARWEGDLRRIQGFWSERARERGILTEEDLEALLSE